MEDYDDLGSYNGDVEHDMWVDYDHYQNTGNPTCSMKKILMKLLTN